MPKPKIKDLYKKKYTRLKRVYGRYKRYGIEYIGKFEDFFKAPKKPTAGTLRRMEKAENKIRAAGEKAMRDQAAELIIDNMLYEIEQYASGLNAWTKDAMKKSADLLSDIVNNAVDEHGLYQTGMAAKKYMAAFSGMIRRLVRAIYDPEFRNPIVYNGAPGRWKTYKKGANAYVRTVNEFARALGTTPSQTLLSTMGGNVI